MDGRRLGTVGLLLALVANAPPVARAAPDANLTAALDAAAGADVVVFDLPAVPGAPRIHAVTLVRAPAATIKAVLLDPTRYQALLPALVGSDEIARTGDVRRLAWELEVPLFNLSGALALRPLPDGVEMLLTDGDLAPGRIVFRMAPRPDGRTMLEIDAQLDVRRSSWFLRQVMARSPFGEPAALSAAAWVALRATALRAEHAREATAFRPTAPGGSAPGTPDGRALFDPRLAGLSSRGAAALVQNTPSGRLGSVSVAVQTSEGAASLAARLADPRSWRAFPGWRTVTLAPPPHAARPTVTVEDGIPFVDLDATWQAQTGPRALWWVAVEGAARGAWFGWDVQPTSGGTQAVLTLQPRLEQTGTIPRRFIAAEPLLEHGMALALAFVDALGAKQATQTVEPATRGGAR
jgi:hypothetical protein